MPWVNVSMREGAPVERKRAIAQSIHDGMVDAIGLPDEDYFVAIHEHGEGAFYAHPTFYGIERTEDAILVQITLRDRGLESKRALYARIVGRLSEKPGLRPGDVFINLINVPNENWSFGNGEAQLAEQPAPW
jgi:phenylpyruvate tautomerase PptA (4-oxalocrotonate tautomerase family)